MATQETLNVILEQIPTANSTELETIKDRLKVLAIAKDIETD